MLQKWLKYNLLYHLFSPFVSRINLPHLFSFVIDDRAKECLNLRKLVIVTLTEMVILSFEVPCPVTFVFLSESCQQGKVLIHKKNDYFIFKFFNRPGLFPRDFVQVSV